MASGRKRIGVVRTLQVKLTAAEDDGLVEMLTNSEETEESSLVRKLIREAVRLNRLRDDKGRLIVHDPNTGEKNLVSIA